MSEEFGAKFIQDYSALLIRVWTDEQEKVKLLADPTTYAKDSGLPVADGARVEVDRSTSGRPHKEALVQAWTGRPGVHVLCVPENAPLDLSELSESELDSVAAGGNNVIVIIL